MYYEILIKRESRVTRLLNYMLDEKNDLKILQCYRLKMLINQAKVRAVRNESKKVNQLYNQRKEYVESLRK